MLDEECRTMPCGMTTEERKEYHRKQAEIVERFKSALFNDLGIEANPKRALLFDIAWREGHSSAGSAQTSILMR